MKYMKISGMTCEGCAVHVKEALEKVPGVKSATVSYPKGGRSIPSFRNHGRPVDGRCGRGGVWCRTCRPATPQVARALF